MSQENVEIVRSIYRSGDPDGFFDLLDEEVELDASLSSLFPDHPEHVYGKSAVVDYYRDYWGTWDEYSLEPIEVVDAGEDRVLVVHHERGHGRGSGAPFERRWAVLYTLRASKFLRIQSFATREEALEAAGLRE
jgi:ketosteroid isomerase-like protein